jgi:hypothetical protein
MMPSVIRFSVPLPPPPLRSNSRHHWGAKVRAKQDYSRAVWGWVMVNEHEQMTAFFRDQDPPWKAAAVSYEWHYCGNAPDEGNLGQNLKALQDIICVAPDNGLQVNNTIYLGLVENDKHIAPSYSMVKEARRAAERVEVTVTQREP